MQTIAVYDRAVTCQAVAVLERVFPGSDDEAGVTKKRNLGLSKRTSRQQRPPDRNGAKLLGADTCGEPFLPAGRDRPCPQ